MPRDLQAERASMRVNVHGLDLWHVVHVAVVPEPQVEIEPPALPGADAHQVVFHVAPHRREQMFALPHILEDPPGLPVAPEHKQRSRVIKLKAVNVRALLDEMAENRSRLRMPLHLQQCLHHNEVNCLCTWFRFDQDAAGARFGAQSLQEQGQEGSVALSAPIETKDELVETGLEALGAQPVADAPRPALEIAERGVDPSENFMGGTVADGWGRWRDTGSRSTIGRR